jgi:ABC-2 type transport system permease protein
VTDKPKPEAAAQILDRGYRTYEGPRGGTASAMRSTTVQGIRSVLGIGRSARAKILPVISAAMAFVVPIVFIGLAVFIPTEILDPNEIATYSDFYGFIISAIVLFTGLVAPEVLTGDRRTGMIALYLSTPLTRTSYLAAKLAAIGITLGIVTIGPGLLLLLGYSFAGAGPSGITDWITTLLQIIAAGLVISAVYASVSMAFSSITDRRAFASAGVILCLLVSAAVSGALVEVAELSQNWLVLNLFVGPFDLVAKIYGESGSTEPALSTRVLVLGNAGWVVAGLGFTWLRYLKMEVTR